MSSHLCNIAAMKLVLADLRKIRNLTQEKLAELSGLHRSTIARIEIQNIGWTHQTLETLADALQCEVWELFGYAHPPETDLSKTHKALLAAVCNLDARAAKLLLAQCNAMINEGMVLPEATEPVRKRRRGRPRKTASKPP